jgi:hypothetical protein
MFVKRRVLVITSAALGLSTFVELHGFQPSPSPPNGSTPAKIARALSAAPPDIAKAATVAEVDRDGKMTVLPPGRMRDPSFCCRMEATGRVRGGAARQEH